MKKSAVSAVIFDLDGTLVDSIPGIEASVKFALCKCLPDQAVPDLRAVIGPPIPKMLRQLWPNLSGAVIDSLVATFREHYDNAGCLQCRAYDGVRETVCDLSERGVQLFVLTNKPHRPTKQILKSLGLTKRFQAIVSSDSFDPPFASKSAGARNLRDKFELNPESTLLVGDGADDAKAAVACGFRFVVAGYGYGTVGTPPDECAVGVLKSLPEIVQFVL